MKYKKERAYRKNRGIQNRKYMEIHGNTVNIRKIYKLNKLPRYTPRYI